jgi:hypothetical protein
MRVPVVAALALGWSLASACNNNCVRERCAYPALLLTVHDEAAGDYLSEATVSQGGTPLSTELTAVFCADGSCTHAVTPPAAGRLTISLTNYQDAFVDYVPRHDSCGNMVRQAVDVGMVPTTSLTSPQVSPPRELGAGCNGP